MTYLSSRSSLVTLCLAAAMAVATVATPLVGVLAPLLRDEIAIPPASVGFLVAHYATVSALASWPAGLVADRVGGRFAVTFVFAGSAVALWGVAFATSYSWMVGAMALAGLANSMVNPATNHVIAYTVEPGRRGFVAGVKMAGVQAGVFVVGILIPFFNATVGWRTPLALGSTVVCGVGMVVALQVIEGKHSFTRRDRARLKLSAGLVALTIYSLLMSAGASASLTYLPLYSVDELGASVGVGGLGVAVAGLSAIGGRLFWSRVTERSQIVMGPLLIISITSVVACLLVLSASEAVSISFWIGSVGVGFFALSFSAATTVALILTVAGDRAGSASGVIFAGFMIGFGLGPAGFGLLVESWGGYTRAWTAVALVFGAAVLVSLAAIKWESRALRSTPASGG